MHFEKLDQVKFKPIPKDSLIKVRGGEGQTTAGGSQKLQTKTFVKDGKVYTTFEMRSWGSDEIDGKDICYYEVEYYWTEPVVIAD